MDTGESCIDTGLLRGDLQELDSLLAEGQVRMQEIERQLAQMKALWSGEAQEQFCSSCLTELGMLIKQTTQVKNQMKRIEEAAVIYEQCEAGVGELVRSR